ncbi:vWA domain-containing protein [Candidatus Electronema sp. JM]|uniref:vWA domain-containing protein n=1 Tax=Candidatus Electronema sp. JM TaxID=3401571 RepID=UPI003AA8D260
MNTRRILFFRRRLNSVLPLLALAMLFVLAAACTGSADRLQLNASFDSDHIYAARPGAHYLEVLVTAPEALGQRRRVPLNLALVLDTSGSMAEQNKLNYVKQAAIAMLNRLRPEDRFALIAYSNRARVLYPSQPVEDGQRMEGLINSLEATGGTNLGEGLIEGFQQVRRHATPSAISRVLLLSDGLANIGITSNGELAQLVQAQAAEGISLSSFGVGLEFNEDLLAAIAETGRGTYYFIDHPESMNSILAKEFKSVEQLAAADIRVTITLGSDLAVDQVFANTYAVDGNTVTVRFGDLAAGERRRMQIRVLPKQRGAGRLDNAARVSVSYLEPGSAAPLSLSDSLGVIYTDDEKSVASRQNKEVLERAAVFEANQAKKEAALAVDKGDQSRAAAILGAARNKIEAVAPAAASPKVQNELTQMDSYAQSVNKPMDSKERSLEQKKVKHRAQAVEGC